MGKDEQVRLVVEVVSIEEKSDTIHIHHLAFVIIQKDTYVCGFIEMMAFDRAARFI